MVRKGSEGHERRDSTSQDSLPLLSISEPGPAPRHPVTMATVEHNQVFNNQGRDWLAGCVNLVCDVVFV